jgi:DNA-binding NarL/FixJ family response regulator/predicted regulator of Ras-like GTPase activity (Roadblock/LC7/MglB family)
MPKSSVLLVIRDPALGDQLKDILTTSGRCADIATVSNFEQAVDHLTAHLCHLVITQINLDGLSGIDLLAGVKGLNLDLPVMMIDEEINARSAIAALRLGAVDYLYQPLNMEFVLMRVENELARRFAKPQAKSNSSEASPAVSHNREAWLSTSKRPAMFILRRPQFVQIEKELSSLRTQVDASFAGLVDAAHNIISAAGELIHADLVSLKRVLAEEYGTRKLANILQESHFSHTYLEGQQKSIFITDFGDLHPVSLVVICPTQVKGGMVWLLSKRAALRIEEILKQADAAQRETMPDDKSHTV